MALSKKIVLFAVAAAVAVGIAGGVIYVGGQRVEDAIVTRLDAQKGRDVNGFVLDWAERTPLQDGRITLRGVTGRFHGEVVLNVASADIERNGLAVKIVAHQLQAEINGGQQTAGTVTITGLDRDRLQALLSIPSRDIAAMVSALDGTQMVAEQVRIESTTMQRAEARFADGRISRLQIGVLHAARDDEILTIGTATVENLSPGFLQAIRGSAPESLAQFLPLVDGTAFRFEQLRASSGQHGTLSAALAHFRFSGDMVHDVQLDTLNFTSDDLSGRIASISFDQLDLVRSDAQMQNDEQSGFLVSSDAGVLPGLGRFGIQGVDVANMLHIDSVSFVHLDDTAKTVTRGLRVNLSELSAYLGVHIGIDEFSIPEIIKHIHYGDNLLTGDIRLPVQYQSNLHVYERDRPGIHQNRIMARDLLNLQIYYQADNLAITRDGPERPDSTRPGALTVNLRFEDHALVDILAARGRSAGQPRAAIAQQARTFSLEWIDMLQVDDTIDLPERISTMVLDNTPLKLGLRITLPTRDAPEWIHIQLVEPGPLSLD